MSRLEVLDLVIHTLKELMEELEERIERLERVTEQMERMLNQLLKTEKEEKDNYLEEEFCGFRLVTGEYCDDWKELSELYNKMLTPLENLRKVLCSECGWNMKKEVRREVA